LDHVAVLVAQLSRKGVFSKFVLFLTENNEFRKNTFSKKLNDQEGHMTQKGEVALDPAALWEVPRAPRDFQGFPVLFLELELELGIWWVVVGGGGW